MNTETKAGSSAQKEASKLTRIKAGVCLGVKVAVTWSCVFLVILTLIAAGQYGQIMSSIDDVRIAAIEEWRSTHPLQQQLASQFLSDCINRKPISERNMGTKSIGIYECGEAMGASDIVDHVKVADETIKTMAWPLSLIE